MRFRFVVDVDVTFTSGKFAARSDIADEINSELENGNPGSLSIGEGEYEVGDWSVSEEDPPKIKRAPRAAPELPCKRCKSLTRLRVKRRAVCLSCQTPDEHQLEAASAEGC